MAENERAIIETISKTLPLMTAIEKERLLAFSEGMAYVAERRETGQTDQAGS